MSSTFVQREETGSSPSCAEMGEVLGMGLGVGMVAKKSKPRATVSLVYLKQKQEQRIDK